MARSKKTTKTTVTRNTDSDNNYLDRIETEIKSNQSTLSLVLGVLIVLVLGVLLFNYFNRDRSATDQNITQQAAQTDQAGDVTPENLPGKYTVKEGDTLYTIAEKYYQDGFKYSELVKTNNLENENAITVGQVLDIPKLEDVASAQTSPSASPEATEVAQATPAASPSPAEVSLATPAPGTEKEGTGGADTTIWGPKIEGDTYTVSEGDWLSTISARAYGDILAYQKIAQANNITNPDVITPGMILKLPR